MKLIRISFLLSLIFISTWSLKSQEIKYGCSIGLDVSTSQFTNLPDNYEDAFIRLPIISFNLNGYWGYKSSKFWGLSVEPGLIQKGFRIASSNFSDNNKKYNRINLNYIQLPILLDLYLKKNFFFSIGPEFAYMIYANAKTNNITDRFNRRTEISGIVGLNYTMMERFDIALRYNHGLTCISDITWTDNLGGQMGTSKEYNVYFQILLRYKLKKTNGNNK